MRKKRILYFALAELNVPGGPAVHTLNKLKGLKEAGADVLLLCPKIKTLPIEKIPFPHWGIPFWGFKPPRIWLFDLISIFYLVKAVFSFWPDCILIREMENNFSVALTAFLCGVPIYIDSNGPFDQEMKPSSSLCRKLWRKFQFLIARGTIYNSAGWRDRLTKEFNVPEKKSLVLSMHVDETRFKIRSAAECRKQVELPPTGLIIGYVGSFQPYHEIEAVLNALEWIKHQGHTAYFVLIGGGNNMAEHVQKFSHSPHAQQIHFVGWVEPEQLAVYLNAFDVGTALMTDAETYRSEAQVKVKEYLACGVPILLNGDPDNFSDYPQDALAFVQDLKPESVGQSILKCWNKKGTQVMDDASRWIHHEYSLANSGTKILNFINQ